MKKNYMKPEIEVISLITQEKITADVEGALTDGSTGLESIGEMELD